MKTDDDGRCHRIGLCRLLQPIPAIDSASALIRGIAFTAEPILEMP
jgi:hypothetical protein